MVLLLMKCLKKFMTIIKKTKHYEDYYVSPKTIATAVFDYLERKKIKVNRKSGVNSDVYTIGGFKIDGCWVKIVK